ncbi:DUF881 domain-containing protein [Pullulanibacillus sp. KACC 23026]|uniref:DUF881 domain-containing protein n=1 Tax=Pullulanibacillus sp. KACC 23026 TaxID=3028315 RepID=UPI0023B11750|nr:DUF881 domain-containing protein [Pullulanibacillus sp. KACC 23026]WEG11661.1 DUF881 domain-containing protein [Pullulanibacillus sp. KACC 23026]
MGNKIILSLILLVTGFILAYSYQYVKNHHIENGTANAQYQQEKELRDEIISEQNSNRSLQNQLNKVRGKIQTNEENLAKQKTTAGKLVTDLTKYRMLNGQTKVSGPGVKIVLSDANYVPNGTDPNDYIVHQQDIQEVIYELNAIGAEAIAINGQRFSSHSYIECVGPVVKVDGERHSAPFVISAIGDSDLLMSGLNMTGGVVETLIERGIDVSVEKVNSLTLDPLL